jgi:DNA modification methylase
LHNVNIVNKSCFTNCSSLKKIYCSDLITYIGEWAFAYCSSLEEVSVKEGAIIDNNAFSNCPAKLIAREGYSNYLIESDNAYTLAGMQKAYKGKIDSILIDPPYNSHIDYIGYKDGNYENGYLNFMETRIKNSYKLLSDKGFLVINIDEGEVDNLTNLCIDIFGEPLVKVYKWKKLHAFFDANRNVNPNKKVVLYEYIIICRKTEKAQLNQIMQPYIENGELKEKVSEVPDVFDCFGTTSSAKDEICELFGKRDYFSTPKPLKLMKELIRATTSKDSIVMDYFAGSGTVGHACVDLNKEDGGNRTFILVCNNESNICENVTSKRLNKINAEYVFMK